ncbi:hypothetical protein K443DRAFT_680429 [Laccaria amethystina LaAM-08-1]|uniref:Uncharacterized protein n=1 Tax=Laccaria amethystina LaAM-08-1 TaxID=1095629 RepID=A0A0C9WN73_9AGAR|nr:hypothetical protein K443DRAFT_680429 [Laccaria amethystina LaAM-08-1]
MRETSYITPKTSYRLHAAPTAHCHKIRSTECLGHIFLRLVVRGSSSRLALALCQGSR